MDKSQQDKLSIGEASKYLGVAIETLRRWDKTGKITSYRSPGGHRYFLRSDLKKLFRRKYKRKTKKQNTLSPTARVIITPPKQKIAVKSNKRYPLSVNTFSKDTKKEPLTRKIALLTLFFFIALDIILISFFLAASNLVTTLP